MLKRFSIAFLVVTLLIGTASLVVAETKVTFWHAMSQYHQEALKEITNSFEETHPSIDVKLTYQGGYGDLSQKLITAAPANQLPVAAQQYEDWTSQYVNADILISLQNKVSQKYIKNLPKALVDSCTFQDELYVLPFNKSAMVLYYNTELVENPPDTWQELLTKAKKLTVDQNNDGKPDQYGFGIKPYAEMFSLFFHQAGGQFFNEDKTEMLIDSKAGIEALKFVKKLRKHSLYQSGYLSGPFGSGKIAMYIGSSAGIPYVASASEGNHGWSTAVLPKGPENGGSMIQGTNVGIFTAGVTKEQQQAGLEFIKFLVNDSNTIKWAKQTGYIPVKKSAIDSNSWQQFIKENPRRKATSKMMLNGFVYPHHQEMYSIRSEYISSVLEKVLLDVGAPKPLLEQAAKSIEKKYLN